MRPRVSPPAFVLLIGAIAAPALPASPTVTTEYGIDFVTVGDPGNNPFPGGDTQFNIGRGGVDYEYRIAQTEMTTGVWLEFVNTFALQDAGLFKFARPANWGARAVLLGGGLIRYELNDTVENAADVAIGGVSWIDSAMFANWLHHDKPSDIGALLHGAYDLEGVDPYDTFAYGNPDLTVDQMTPTPDARFWIPTVDEWMKAARYRPSEIPGQGEWDAFENGLDQRPVPGLPDEGGQTSATLFRTFDPEIELIPVASYELTSHWGLYDISGGYSELTQPNGPMPFAPIMGSSIASDEFEYGLHQDPGFYINAIGPSIASGRATLRLATGVPIPTPTSAALFVASIIALPRTRSRYEHVPNSARGRGGARDLLSFKRPSYRSDQRAFL